MTASPGRGQTGPEAGQADRVLIVGGGPVGMITALLLARWDVPSVILEAQPEAERVGSKAICFQRDVLDIFDRIGIADQAVMEGVTWRIGRTYYRDRLLFTTELPDSGSDALPPFINLSQASLEGYLRAAVDAAPLVTLRSGHRVLAITTGTRPADDHVEVTVQTPTSTVTRSGSHLVAADGSRSTIRQAIGATFDGESFDEQFLIADIQADLPFPAERRFYFDPVWNPGRQVLVHPQPDNIWRIDWQVPADFDLQEERSSGGLDARIRQITGDTAYRIDWVSAYRFHQRMAEPWRRGRVFLAGDAAHLMSPFGARGLNSGAQDAENLAWKLAWTIKRQAGPELLDSYSVERMAAARENLAVTAATMRFLVPQTPEQAAHRTATLQAALDDPAAHHRVNSGSLARPFCYADSPLTTRTHPTGVATDELAPGALCPDGPLTLAGRPRVRRLRQLLGHNLIVLAHPTHAVTDPRTVTIQLDPAAHPLPEPGWLLVRPDGHIAAVGRTPDPATLTAAVDQILPPVGARGRGRPWHGCG